MSRIVVNYSGHPLSREARRTLEAEFDVVLQTQPIQFDFSLDVNEQLKQVCNDTLAALDADSTLTLIPPGQSTVAILLVSYIHGILGHFPRICYLELGEQGLYLPHSEFQVDLQHARTAGRVFRMKRFG